VKLLRKKLKEDAPCFLFGCKAGKSDGEKAAADEISQPERLT
jgi:hypothetical protein